MTGPADDTPFAHGLDRCRLHRPLPRAGDRAVNAVFPDCPITAVPHILADVDAARAQAAAASLGFERATTDWREAVDEAEAIVIAVPSNGHAEIARRALAQGKPFLCEKPVGLSSEEAQSLADEAARGNVVNAVGFTYLRAPLVRHAKRLIQAGTIGRPVHFYGRHFEDYLASPDAPFSWRLSAATAGRCGALGDLGCHILSVARFLCGPVEALAGSSALIHPQRPTGNPAGPCDRSRTRTMPPRSALRRRNAGPDRDQPCRPRPQDGSQLRGYGRTRFLRFEAERMNELGLYLDERSGSGFRRILMMPDHPDYGAFLPAPGHGLGFNDLKTIEIKAFLDAIAAGRNSDPDLAEAARIGRLCEAIIDSAASGQWINTPEAVIPPARATP